MLCLLVVAEKVLAWLDAHPALAEWGLVGVGVLTLAVIAWQSAETKHAARAAADTVAEVQRQTRILEKQAQAAIDNAASARESAELATKSIDILIAKERPRIKIIIDDFKLSLTEFQGVSYRILCSCPTRASIISARANAYVAGILGQILTGQISELPEIVNETVTIKASTGVLLDGAGEREAINAGRLHFQAVIEYKGDHLSDTDPPYRTTFHSKLSYTSQGIPGLNQYSWERYGPSEDNQED